MYKIVFSNTLTGLERKVQDLLDLGWGVLPGLTVVQRGEGIHHQTIYYKEMMKHELPQPTLPPL
jgi:hypothetical protein